MKKEYEYEILSLLHRGAQGSLTQISEGLGWLEQDNRDEHHDVYKWLQ